MSSEQAIASKAPLWPCWKTSPWTTIRSWHYFHTYTLPRLWSLLVLTILPFLGVVHQSQLLFWTGTAVVFLTDYVMFGRIADERRGAVRTTKQWREAWRQVEQHQANAGGQTFEFAPEVDPLESLPVPPPLWLPTEVLKSSEHTLKSGDLPVSLFGEEALKRLAQAATRRFLKTIPFPGRTLFRVQADDGKPSVGMLLRVDSQVVVFAMVSFYGSHGQLMCNAWTGYYSEIPPLGPGGSTSGRSYLGDQRIMRLRTLVKATRRPLRDWIDRAISIAIVVPLLALKSVFLWFPAIWAVKKFVKPAIPELLTGNRLGVFRRHHRPEHGESADYHALDRDRTENASLFLGVPRSQTHREAMAVAEAVDMLAFVALNPE